MKILFALTLLLFGGAAFTQDLSNEILSAGEDIPQAQIDRMIDGVLSIETYETMTFPVQGGAKVISKFGDPRPNGRIHEGIDLGAPRTRPILAAWTGAVVYNHYDRLGGWSVKLRHKNGLATYYAHMNTQSTVKVAAVMTQGMYLGPVGNSGDAAGGPTHCHFGVYSSRGAINPAPFLKGAKVIPLKKAFSLAD